MWLCCVLTDGCSTNVGVGLMGVAGNKGAVAVRFQLYDSQYAH